MLVARTWCNVQVQSTLNYSRKLAALGRFDGGSPTRSEPAQRDDNPPRVRSSRSWRGNRRSLPRAWRTTGRIADPGYQCLRRTSPNTWTSFQRNQAARRRAETGFLKFARPDELKLQPVRMASLISDIQTSVAPEAGRRHITMKIECPDSVPEINADPGMLSQALLNLALNACQAMPDGGTLKLSCRTASRHRVEIDIEDTGVGIPPEHLGRIVDLYFTTKEKGRGIGLSMVYRIVQLHDGEVEVQSTPGRGTRFRLIFPQA